MPAHLPTKAPISHAVSSSWQHTWSERVSTILTPLTKGLTTFSFPPAPLPSLKWADVWWALVAWMLIVLQGRWVSVQPWVVSGDNLDMGVHEGRVWHKAQCISLKWPLCYWAETFLPKSKSTRAIVTLRSMAKICDLMILLCAGLEILPASEQTDSKHPWY